jgi:thiosulfate dehydrogenase [quinone] large subunit
MESIKTFFRPRNIEVEDPPLAKAIFGNTAFAWVWLIVRVWLGWQWVSASLHKLFLTDPTTGATLYGQFNPAWVVTGEALKGFWLAALKTDPKAVIYFDWYRQFIQMMVDTQSYTWFAKLVAFGELAIGVAMILGAFVGVAAFFGAFMNWNFMLAGTTSSNPLLFITAILLMLSWKVAGYYGLDRWLLPMLGTPWKIGYLLHPGQGNPQPKPTTA